MIRMRYCFPLEKCKTGWKNHFKTFENMSRKIIKNET